VANRKGVDDVIRNVKSSFRNIVGYCYPMMSAWKPFGTVGQSFGH
jgi:hypothetical protein